MTTRLKENVRAARAGGTGNGGTPAADREPTAKEQRMEVVRSVVAELRRLEPEFAKAMPRGADPGQLVRDTVSVLQKNPELLDQDIDPQTIYGAVMTCAQLGLRPGVMGEAWILPFKNRFRGCREATFVAGYRGLAKLAHQSGLIAGLSARTVYQRDHFDFSSEHDGDKLVHKPTFRGERGEPWLYYARALLLNGGYQLTEPSTHEDMLAHRAAHVRITSGPWFDDTGKRGCGFEAMAWKTEVKRLAKLLPLDSRLGAAIEADEGVRTNLNPKIPADKVTEQYRDGALQGVPVAETPPDGAPPIDWSTIPEAQPVSSARQQQAGGEATK